MGNLEFIIKSIGIHQMLRLLNKFICLKKSTFTTYIKRGPTNNNKSVGGISGFTIRKQKKSVKNVTSNEY